jgi:hypothetical protein
MEKLNDLKALLQHEVQDLGLGRRPDNRGHAGYDYKNAE